LVLTNLVALLLAIFWPAIEHRHVKWSAGPVGVEIKRGVFWKHRIAIPWARVQHADVSQGPLARQFALGNLTIHTAGTKHASIEIEGLNHTVAIELRDEVIRQRKVGDVV
jgi:membrane protein YdbS with pleckstrin-like domain